MKSIKKTKILKSINRLQDLIEKCGGPGGTMGPCPTGHQKVTTRSGEVLHPIHFNSEKREWTLADGNQLPSHLPPIPHPINKEGKPNPGAWKDIRVNLDPKGDLLVQGTDTKGRTQPRYSDNHTMKVAADKFGRVSELRKKR